MGADGEPEGVVKGRGRAALHFGVSDVLTIPIVEMFSKCVFLKQTVLLYSVDLWGFLHITHTQ